MTGPRRAPVTMPSAARVARAVVEACRIVGVDPAAIYLPGSDGRGMAKMIAALALSDATTPRSLCARALKLHPNQLSPSAVRQKRVRAENVERVRAALARLDPAQAVAAPVPAARAVKTRRGEGGWTDPRRDLDREERILAARLAGETPKTIATREGLALSTVKRAIARGAATTETPVPVLRPGPAPKAPKAPKSPKPGKTRPPRAAAAKATTPSSPPAKAIPAPLPAAPVETVEAFPADHPAWRPLPGSTPSRLVDHHKGCRWPVEVPGRLEPMVCDLPATWAGPYCPRHAWLALTPAARAERGLGASPFASKSAPFVMGDYDRLEGDPPSSACAAPNPAPAPRLAAAFSAADLKEDAA